LLACQATARVATLLLCRDLSGLFYPFLDVRTAHRPTSHEDESDACERVTRYCVSQWAYLAEGVLDYVGKGNDNRKLCSLYLALMKRLGVPAERFGDAAAPLAGL